MNAGPGSRPDNGRKKSAAIGVAAALAIGSAILDAIRPGLVDQLIVVHAIILSLAALWWMYLDAAERPLVRPNVWEIVFALIFVPIGLGLYLMRSRSTLKGLGLMLVILIVTAALYAAAFFVTLGMMQLLR